MDGRLRCGDDHGSSSVRSTTQDQQQLACVCKHDYGRSYRRRSRTEYTELAGSTCGSRVATDPWPSGPPAPRLHESSRIRKEAAPWFGAQSARRFNWCTSGAPDARPATTAALGGSNRETSRTASSCKGRHSQPCGRCRSSIQQRRRRDDSQADHIRRRGSSGS